MGLPGRMGGMLLASFALSSCAAMQSAVDTLTLRGSQSDARTEVAVDVRLRRSLYDEKQIATAVARERERWTHPVIAARPGLPVK